MEEQGKVYRLRKALYGLKQAPRAWYGKINGYFAQQGFEKSKSEPTLYTRVHENDILIISLYVDDLIFTGSNKAMIQEFKTDMMQSFKMNDLGLMHYFLGMEVSQGKEGIFICQKKYIEDILSKFKMLDCKAVTTPLVPGEKLRVDGVKRPILLLIEV